MKHATTLERNLNVTRVMNHLISKIPSSEEIPLEVQSLEHWTCTEWLGEKLQEKGETISQSGIPGVLIWSRDCSGQTPAQDSVIQEIAEEN